MIANQDRYLLADKTRFLKKNFGGPNLDPVSQNQAYLPGFFAIFSKLVY